MAVGVVLQGQIHHTVGALLEALAVRGNLHQARVVLLYILAILEVTPLVFLVVVVVLAVLAALVAQVVQVVLVDQAVVVVVLLLVGSHLSVQDKVLV
jgi:uncharacterized membrane protein (DUF106 family)